jgi:hypothetical protein
MRQRIPLLIVLAVLAGCAATPLKPVSKPSSPILGLDPGMTWEQVRQAAARETTVRLAASGEHPPPGGAAFQADWLSRRGLSGLLTFGPESRLNTVRLTFPRHTLQEFGELTSEVRDIRKEMDSRFGNPNWDGLTPWSVAGTDTLPVTAFDLEKPRLLYGWGDKRSGAELVGETDGHQCWLRLTLFLLPG